MNISQFLNEDLSDYASYSTLRMIASAIDGQKNSGRKVLFTVIDKNIKKEIKVSQLASKVAEFSEYLHGEASLQGVIVNMATNYTGSNNINLLEPKGNFGTRFTPEASAPRYIYSLGSKNLWDLFHEDDKNILIQQNFEGHNIEPQFYVPTLPLLLINGAEGIASGFAQKILPRDPKKIKNFIKDYLNNSLKANKNNSLHPYYNGFTGNIINTENIKQFEIVGNIERISSTKIEINEIPIGYSLKGYIKVLDKLEEDGFITNYQDLSEDDNFKFIISFKKVVLDSLTDDQLLNKLKLIKRVTENYTVIDENNKVKVFDSVKEILMYYIDIKLKYLQRRIDYKIQKLNEDIRLDISKYLFIKNIVDNKLIVNKRKKSEIEKDLDNFDKIIKRDNTYDYLLRMPIYSLTTEKMDELMKLIKDKKEVLDYYKTTTPSKEWLKDLELIKL